MTKTTYKGIPVTYLTLEEHQQLERQKLALELYREHKSVYKVAEIMKADVNKLREFLKKSKVF